MPFLVKKTTTAKNINGDTFTHVEGTVLSDWELSDVIRKKILDGDTWSRELFEPLLEHEAHNYRVKATAEQSPRILGDQTIIAPYDDYVGLHPHEIMERMKTEGLEKVRQIKAFERAGMNRTQITSFVAPSEKEPFEGYDSMGVNEILEKFSILSDAQVEEAIIYETNHRQRPAILEYDRATYEKTDSPEESITSQTPILPIAPPVPDPQPTPPQMQPINAPQ
jgi:hypothetical protein